MLVKARWVEYTLHFFPEKMSKRLGNRNKVIITRQAMHIGFITRPKVIFYSPKRLVKYNFWTRDINLYVTAWCVIIPNYYMKRESMQDMRKVIWSWTDLHSIIQCHLSIGYEKSHN